MKYVLKHDDRDFVDVSFAAATPKGLVVPVIRNVESMSILDVSFTPGPYRDRRIGPRKPD